MAPQSKRRTLDLLLERFAYRSPFRISGHVFTEPALLVAALSDGEHVGRGEGSGVYYLGDDADHMLAEAERARGDIEDGATRDDLPSQPQPSGHREGDGEGKRV